MVGHIIVLILESMKLKDKDICCIPNTQKVKRTPKRIMQETVGEFSKGRGRFKMESGWWPPSNIQMPDIQRTDYIGSL